MTLDVIVIGAGPAGEVVAGRCADGGLSVAVVERELVGGECSYWGCMPSKALIRPGDTVAAARRVPGAAAAVTGSIDADAVFAWRDRITSSWDDSGATPWLTDKGIELIRGTGRIVGQRSVEVTDSDGGARTLSAARAVVLATGTSAVIPPIPGLDAVDAWNNRDATAAHEVPARLLVLGGGAIGLELAQAYRRLGSDEVAVVEGGSRLLAREEPFAGEEVRAAFEAEGITVHTGTKVASAERRRDGSVALFVENGPELVGDELLVATGRRPATDDLGLESVGLAPGQPVDVDDQMRTADIDWLFAVGDCNGRALLTHMGKYQARIAADVILGKDAVAIADHTIVPRVTFTDPQVCAVGLTEEQAIAAGHAVRTVRHATGGVAGGSVLAEDYPGTSQLVIDTERDVVVGATFVGSGTQELLHSATIAIAGEVPLDRLWHAVPAFPTLSEVWLRLLEADGR